MEVNRVYVERKRDYAEDANKLLTELKSFLNLNQITDLQIFDRYDVEGVGLETFEKSVKEIIYTAEIELAHYSLPPSDYIIPIELLPGQFDQIADSCAKSIQIINDGKLPLVKYAKIILLYGDLDGDDLARIENYLINDVECRKASLELPTSLKKKIPQAPPVAIIDGFTNLTEEKCPTFISEYELAMDPSDLLFCRNYFKKENRDPSITELKMIDTYWSDHCRHTTFFTEIDEVKIEDPFVNEAFNDYLNMRELLNRQDKPITLMDIATIGAKYLKHQGLLKDLDESEEINACSVNIDVDIDDKSEPWLLMFKNETHNHPTEIEPFGGAATCLGGAIRDPLSGRSFVYQAMRIGGAHNPLLPFEETLEGKLPQRTISKKSAAGYSSYGNQIGIASGLVKEIYHPGYLAKRLEMGAVVAAAPKSQVIRHEPQEGDLIILLGGKTGRDGLGGATGSSKSHDLDSLENSGPQVQKGNPSEERKIQRLFRKPELAKLIKRCNDFGAGGVSVAVGELADSLHIDLDKVPLKYEGLDGTEIAISESQERMAVVIDKNDLEAFLNFSKEENLEATVIAEVTSTGRLTMSYKGETIVDLSREFLNSNGADKHINLKVPFLENVLLDTHKTKINSFESLVADLNHCSQKGMAEMFDATAGGNTVLMPYGGIYQESPSQAMASKIPVMKGNTTTCSLASYGFDPYLSEKNPFWGAYTAVIHSVGKLVASGANIDKCWLSFQEYFEKLADDPEKWGKPFAALLGALKAQKDLGLAAIGGKDSMSGSFENINVPPTLISVAVGLGNTSNISSPEFKGVGNPVVYMEAANETILSFYKRVGQLIKDKKVESAYAISGGGIGEAIFEMSLGNRIGLDIEKNWENEALFKSRYGSFVLELNPLSFRDEKDYPGQSLGITKEDFTITHGENITDLYEVRDLYQKKLEDIYPINASEIVNHETQCPPLQIANNVRSSQNAKPSFLIPLFPGDLGEYELIKKIDEAGGKADVFVFNNYDKKSIEESLNQLILRIAKNQAIVFPGGSGNFLTTVLMNEQVRAEVSKLVDQRDGLILGLGSGFISLMKSGLLPTGYGAPACDHYSGFANVEISSIETPWFAGLEEGEIQKLPISMDNTIISIGESKSKIVARFLSGGIEALASPCGKVLGRLSRFERTGSHLYQNIPGSCPVNLFYSAVKYYK